MVIKATNKDDKFYSYMGKFFGSRIIERETNDRLYDDNNKLWYIYLANKKPLAFVSVSKNIIKNVYAIKDEYLENILNEIKKDNKITHSIVTNIYLETYIKCGFKVDETHTYKNFVTIYM